MDTFGANDLALDYNMQSGDNSAFRFMMHSDALENHRDHYDGDRLGINPTLKLKLSDKTTLIYLMNMQTMRDISIEVFLLKMESQLKDLKRLLSVILMEII